MPNHTQEEVNNFIDLQKVVAAVIRWWWLLIIATIVGALVGRVVSQMQTPVYAASSTLLVGQSIQSVELDSRDFAVSEQMAQTYAQFARLQPVLQRVIDTLEIDASWQELARRVVATPIEGTQFLKITTQASSPTEAEALANQIATELISLSPTTVLNTEFDEDQRFAIQRLGKLRANIEQSQQQIDQLQTRMLGSDSLAAKQEIQSEIDVRQNLILGWEENYARLLTLAGRGSMANVLTLVVPAQATSSPIRPRTLLNMSIIALAYLALALAFVGFLELRDETIRTPTDLSGILGMDSLGTTGHIRGKNKLITTEDPLSPVAESYAIIGSRIRFRNGNQLPRTILITSPNRNEGKSVTVANLGVVLARSGFRTIVVDTHLLHPALGKLFNVPDQGGILDILQSNEFDLKSQLKKTDVKNLQVLTRGATPYDNKSDKTDQLAAQRTIARLRSQLLASHLDAIVANLSELADVVLFDSPPLLTSTEAVVLSGQVDAIVLVFRAGQTRASGAKQAILSLHQGGANLIGGILNQTSSKGRI